MTCAGAQSVQRSMCCRFLPGDAFADHPPVQGADVAGNFVTDRLLDKAGAGLHASTATPRRRDRYHVIAAPVSFALELLQQLRPPMPGIRVDHEATLPASTINGEERLAAIVDFDRSSVRLKQVAQRLAHGAIIVDHENSRPAIVGERRRARIGEQLFYQVKQRRCRYWFAEMYPALAGDLAQHPGGDIPTEDDRWDIVPKCLLQAGDDLSPSAIGEIVVGEDKIRPH